MGLNIFFSVWETILTLMERDGCITEEVAIIQKLFVNRIFKLRFNVYVVHHLRILTNDQL